ncbi:hypothetical protein [Streptomyces mirabilis]|uniref:hypothetical protein n=1 Tax=Streptomyces mirabilis TaxID=68239 RepID=UPI0036DA3883
MMETTEVYIWVAIGMLATSLSFLLLLLFRRLAELRRQLSTLRVQVGILRLAAADRDNKRPPGPDRSSAQPPEGARRRGNLWLVPALFGIAEGVGHTLRNIPVRHHIPVAAVNASAMALAASFLYLSGALSSIPGLQGPPTAPHMVTAPRTSAPPHHPAIHRKPGSLGRRNVTPTLTERWLLPDPKAAPTAAHTTPLARVATLPPTHTPTAPTPSPTAPHTTVRKGATSPPGILPSLNPAPGLRTHLAAV